MKITNLFDFDILFRNWLLFPDDFAEFIENTSYLSFDNLRIFVNSFFVACSLLVAS